MGKPSPIVKTKQNGHTMNVEIKLPSAGYLNSLMRANCFPELHDLFRRAQDPAKELTESYAALEHLRQIIRGRNYWRVVHVGDGAHARTAAMFSFLTGNTENFAIDPGCNEKVLSEWRDRWNVRRFAWVKARVEDVTWMNVPTLVTFVHAHVDVDEVLAKIPGWRYAYTNACCQPGRQLSKKHRVVDSGADWRILSPQREFQVLENREFTE